MYSALAIDMTIIKVGTAGKKVGMAVVKFYMVNS